MAEQKLLYIPDADARTLLDMPMALRLVEEDFIQTAKGNALFPSGRMMQLWLPERERQHYFFSKMCALRDRGIVGFRFIGANAANAAKGLPESFRYLFLLDLETGSPRAIVDETWSWMLRTGAEAGVAAKFLARRGTQRIGLVGAGLMAGTTLAALREVLQISEVRVTSKRAESRHAFAARMAGELGIGVIPAETVEEALEGADIVVTATTANAPLVRARVVKPGALILSMGTHQELDPDVFRCVSKVVPDDWEKCKIWGDLAIGLQSGTLAESGLYGELGEIVSGQRPGRERDDEIILAVPQGMITQDVALAHFVYERALAEGLGRWMSLE